MHPTRVMIATALLLCLVVLASCASGGAPAKPSVSSEPSDAAEMAQLVDVDTTAVPTGPSVGELISADDFADILGRDDLTFAPAL